MSFYAHPTRLISPRGIFPSIPISISVPPLRVSRKSKHRAFFEANVVFYSG